VVVLEKSDEKVLGEIIVTVKLPMGFERVRLYFTDRRIILGHLGKIGAGSIAPTFMFGSIGSALGGLFGRKGAGRKTRSGHPSPEKILASRPDNFSILFDEIISVHLTRESYKISIAILSKNDKFEFTSPSRFELVRSLFENALRDKVRVNFRN
jgi:hypothetical protein